MGIFQNNLMGAAAAAASAGGGGFYSHQIAQAVRFEEDAGDKIARTPGSSGNRRTWTVSFWYKKTHNDNSGNHMVPFGADAGSGNYFHIRINNTDNFQFAGNGFELIPNAKVRDLSGWGHYVFTIDTTQASSGDRAKMYVNGTQITSFSSNTIPGQNTETAVNQSGVEQELGVLGYGSNTTDFAGYVADFVLIDGTAYGPDSFGESKNGVWIPKDPSGLTFGTNGVYLKFENASDLGNDSSGNNNDYSVTNMGTDHQVLDSPTFGS